jgi:hypothetical protein
MRRVEKAVRLRVYIGEDDKYKGRPMYEEIVVQAQAARLAGATVVQGYTGYGKASGFHPGKLLRTSKDLPIIVEIIDAEEKVTGFLDILDKLMGGGVATVEPVDLYRYSRDKQKPA